MAVASTSPLDQSSLAGAIAIHNPANACTVLPVASANSFMASGPSVPMKSISSAQRGPANDAPASALISPIAPANASNIAVTLGPAVVSD